MKGPGKADSRDQALKAEMARYMEITTATVMIVLVVSRLCRSIASLAMPATICLSFVDVGGETGSEGKTAQVRERTRCGRKTGVGEDVGLLRTALCILVFVELEGNKPGVAGGSRSSSEGFTGSTGPLLFTNNRLLEAFAKDKGRGGSQDRFKRAIKLEKEIIRTDNGKVCGRAWCLHWLY